MEITKEQLETIKDLTTGLPYELGLYWFDNDYGNDEPLNYKGSVAVCNSKELQLLDTFAHNGAKNSFQYNLSAYITVMIVLLCMKENRGKKYKGNDLEHLLKAQRYLAMQGSKYADDDKAIEAAYNKLLMEYA